MKGIYEEEDEILPTSSNESLDLVNKNEAETDVEFNEEDGIKAPAVIEGNAPEKEGDFDENEYEVLTGKALKLRYRIFNDIAIRHVTDDKKNVWFVADDVCKVLGYKNTFKAIADHCGKVIDSKDIDNEHCFARKINVKDANGHAQAMTAISEGDLYRLVIRSRMPEARIFESWVCDEVIPQIRKTGKYAVKRKITMSTPEAQAKYEAAKAALSEQCELFPNVVQSITFPKPMTDKINAVKKRLFDEGHTFPNDKEFLKFLVTRALEQLEA